jgi:Ser/Thr protein kinase RdoA (MazF antagonist)
MNPEIVRQILQHYGIANAQLLPMQKGYRNESHALVTEDGRAMNLILYKREPGIVARIRNANAVADYLAEQGFAARRTADPRIICLQNGGAKKYGALYHYLPGKTIPWEAYTQNHLKLLGKTMSDMHAALANAPLPDLPLVADEYRSIVQRMQSYFAEPGVQAAMYEKLGVRVEQRQLETLMAAVASCRDLPGQQPLHMDFVRGNILFDSSGISGILDFEKTAFGHPLFDIARTLAFLLVDCKYKSETKVRKYFLYSGYHKRGAATFKDVAVKRGEQRGSLLELLVDLFLLYDFYKFLRHNPYEFLEQNEHFVRTKNILTKREVIWFDRIHTKSVRGDKG